MEMCNRHRNVDCLGSFLLHSLRLWQEWEAVHNPKKLGARTEQAVRSHLHGTTLRPPPIFVGDKAGAESTVAAKLKAWLSSEDGRWWKEQRSALFVSKAAASDDV